MSNVTYDDMLELVNEIELGAKDKTRSLNNVNNSTVKDLLIKESSMALGLGVTTLTAASVGAIGASAGSVIPGVGTVAGAVGGFIVGLSLWCPSPLGHCK